MSAVKLIFVCIAFLVLTTTITVTGEPCEDRLLWVKECANLKSNFGERFCTSRNHRIRNIARNKCKGTCGLCTEGAGRRRAQAPPIKCSKTVFGCCWDRVTAASGPGDQGCPLCADRHRAVCKIFSWMCNRNTPNSDYIKMNCPIRCGFCRPRTRDKGRQESMQSILARMSWKEYRQRKGRKSRRRY